MTARGTAKKGRETAVGFLHHFCEAHDNTHAVVSHLGWKD